MNKKILLIVAVIGVVALSTTVFARGYERGPKGGRDSGYNGRGGCGSCYSSGDFSKGKEFSMMGGYGQRGYNTQLTPEAIEKIRLIDQKYYPQIEKIRADISVQNAIIRGEMAQTSPDKTKITKAMEERSKLSLSLEKLNLERMIEMKNIK